MQLSPTQAIDRPDAGALTADDPPFAAVAALRALLKDRSCGPAGDRLRDLVSQGLDRLPLPGSGATIERWRALAMVAEDDLSLAKLYEGHTDALAILAELGAAREAGDKTRLWGVWAADPPQARPQLSGHREGSRAQVSGRKLWCSGAQWLSHALMTAWNGNDGPWLVIVALDQAAVTVTSSSWRAVGMRGSASVEVQFDHAEVEVIGPRRIYLERPGFWQGGAGIAACWYGGAVGIARTLRRRLRERATLNSLLAAQLGAVDASLQATAALLHRCARDIDLLPGADARVLALRCRAVAESCAEDVLRHVGHALGAEPYCMDASFAQRAADLPVFLRQSHAERDLAELGLALPTDESLWGL